MITKESILKFLRNNQYPTYDSVKKFATKHHISFANMRKMLYALGVLYVKTMSSITSDPSVIDNKKIAKFDNINYSSVLQILSSMFKDDKLSMKKIDSFIKKNNIDEVNFDTMVFRFAAMYAMYAGEGLPDLYG